MHFKFEGLIEGQYGLNGITDRRDRVYPRRFEVKINEEKKKKNEGNMGKRADRDIYACKYYTY